LVLEPGTGVFLLMKLITLKVRREFLRIRGGARWSCPNFVIETKLRVEAAENIDGPRFGFTVTKALGGAVDRNRIRRRLKSAIQALPLDAAKPGYDYVVIARAGAGTAEFAALQKDLEQALQRVHHPRKDGPRQKPPKSSA
jgi:ribonuclease P protein component